MLVDADGLDLLQPLGSLDELSGGVRDRVPAGVPGDPQPSGKSGHGGVIMSQRIGRPKARCVVQHLDSPAMTGRDHATVGTAGQGLIGLYVDTDKALVVTADVE